VVTRSSNERRAVEPKSNLGRKHSLSRLQLGRGSDLVKGLDAKLLKSNGSPDSSTTIVKINSNLRLGGRVVRQPDGAINRSRAGY